MYINNKNKTNIKYTKIKICVHHCSNFLGPTAACTIYTNFYT